MMSSNIKFFKTSKLKNMQIRPTKLIVDFENFLGRPGGSRTPLA